jgi:uncharacterized membrane protein YdjX (TVP38/TMEM64 family)
MTQPASTALLSRPALVRMAVLAATLVAVGWMMDHLGLRQLLATQWMDSEIKGHGWQGMGLFLIVSAVSMSMGIPRQISAFMAGYAFGLGLGSCLALVSALLSASGIFFYAQYMGRDWLSKRFPKAFDWLDQFLSQNTFAMVLALRLVPFSSNIATNLAVGVSGATFLPFLAASFLGYIPQTVAFALLGQGATIDPVIDGVMVVALIGVSSMLGLHMWRKTKKQVSSDGAA